MIRWKGLLGSMGSATLWWVFGLATTLLLISLWGRTVVGDRQVVEEAAQELAQAELISEQVVSWLMSGLELTPASQSVEVLVDLPSVRAAVSTLVEEVVIAAYEPGTSTVDVSGVVVPLASGLAAELEAHGVPVETEAVQRALEKLPPIVLESQSSGPGLAEKVNRPLTTATLLAAVTMATAAALLLGINRDRVATARSLALRVVVSGLSFALVLRVAAWIANPGGGGSPMRRTISVVLSSRPEVPLLVAAVGIALLTATIVARRRREAAVRVAAR